VVARQEAFADLKAVQRLSAAVASTDARVLMVGTGATAAELQVWWKERGLALPPVALGSEAARLLGARSQPLALVVGRAGRVAWAKEGYTPGDEDEWQRQVEHVRERS
jgi:hypothetical protein